MSKDDVMSEVADEYFTEISKIPKEKRTAVRAAERCLHFMFRKLLKGMLVLAYDNFDPKAALPDKYHSDNELMTILDGLRYKSRGYIMSEVNSAKNQAFLILEMVALGGVLPAEFYSESYVEDIFTRAGDRRAAKNGNK